MRGAPTQTTSLLVASTLGAVGPIYLVSWMVQLGFFRHREVRLSLVCGAVGTCLALVCVAFLTGPDAVLDFNVHGELHAFVERLRVAVRSAETEVRVVAYRGVA